MPRRPTLAQLIASCQQQLNLEGHTVIDAAPGGGWSSFISRAYGELWSVVLKSGMQYFETSTTIVSTGANYLAEPADMFAVLGISYTSGLSSYDLKQLQPQERSPMTRAAATPGRAVAFAHVDDKIYLYPTPPSGDNYELRYTFQSPDLTAFASTDCVDVVTPSGHDFLIYAACVHACVKSEASQLPECLRQRDYYRDQLAEDARAKSLLSPRRRIVVSDLDLEGSEFL